MHGHCRRDGPRRRTPSFTRCLRIWAYCHDMHSGRCVNVRTVNKSVHERMSVKVSTLVRLISRRDISWMARITALLSPSCDWKRSSLTVRTHQQSQVQSSPDSRRSGSDSVPYWQWPPQQCVGTHQQSRVESHESCRVKSLDATCFIFVRLKWSGWTKEMGVEKRILLVKDY